MSKISTYQLQEICDFQNGFAFKNSDYIAKSDNSIEVLRMGYIKKGGGFKEDDSPVFIPKKYNKNIDKYLLNKGDVVMAMTDMKNSMAILGYSARIPESNRFVLNQRVGRIRIARIDIVDELYLYYYINSSEYIFNIQSKSNSGVQVNLGTNTIKESVISLPPLDYQRYVVDVLYPLDEKIQLNTKINQTLEQIAQAIFKSWFIDFDPVRAKADALAQGKSPQQADRMAMEIISGKTQAELDRLQTENPTDYQQLLTTAQAFPSEFEEVEGFGNVPKGWEVSTLSQICTMQNGYAFKSNEWTDDGLPVIKIGSVKPMIVEIEGNGFVSLDNQYQRADYLLQQGDILVGLTGYVGEVGRIPKGKIAMLNQRVAKFIPKNINDSFSYYNYIYCLARQVAFKQYAKNNAKGSAQANISTKELLNYPIILADHQVHIMFETYVSHLLDKILSNSYENENLAKTRDLLLPKLLSGDTNE